MQMGFPIMIKATAGGGGRGMRLANNEDEFVNLLKQAQQVRSERWHSSSSRRGWV